MELCAKGGAFYHTHTDQLRQCRIHNYVHICGHAYGKVNILQYLCLQMCVYIHGDARH